MTHDERMKTAIEEVLAAALGAERFTWNEAREEGGLELVCTPSAPDWVEPDDRDGWELAHAHDVWMPVDDRSSDELRADLLALMLCEAIRVAAETHQVRGRALAGLAA